MKEVLNDENITAGSTAALGVACVDGIGQVFGDQPQGPRCTSRAASSAGSPPARSTRTSRSAPTIDWFDFPAIGGTESKVVTIGGDVIAAFNTSRA